MSTINGFGTTYYGWRHQSDGTATATKWLTVSWLPVIPLGRQRLRVLSDLAKPELKSEALGLVVSQVDRYQYLEKLPLSAGELLLTLGKTYIGLPAILILPMLGLACILVALHKFGVDVRPETTAFEVVMLGGGLLVFLNFFWQIVLAIRRARGWQALPDQTTVG